MKKRVTLRRDPRRELARAARELAPLAPEERRRPSRTDHLRVAKMMDRVEQGEDVLDAFWHVASHADFGFNEWRGRRERPDEKRLRYRLASLLNRAVPDLVDEARDKALGRLAHLGDAAARTVQEVNAGNVDDPKVARARLDAAKLILNSIGVNEKSATTKVNVTVFGSIAEKIKAAQVERVRDAD